MIENEEIVYPATVGSLIIYKKKLYYVYEVINNKINCFRITGFYGYQRENSIRLGKIIYTAVWEDKLNITVKTDYQIVDKAEPCQIERVNKEKEKHEVRMRRGLEVGLAVGRNWIVRHKDKPDSRFLVVGRVGNKLLLIRIYWLLENKYDEMFVDDVSLYIPVKKATKDELCTYLHATMKNNSLVYPNNEFVDSKKQKLKLLRLGMEDGTLR